MYWLNALVAMGIMGIVGAGVGLAIHLNRPNPNRGRNEN